MKKIILFKTSIYLLLTFIFSAWSVYGMKVWEANRFPDNNMAGVRPTVFLSMLCVALCGGLIYYTIAGDFAGDSIHKKIMRIILSVALIVAGAFVLTLSYMSPVINIF